MFSRPIRKILKVNHCYVKYSKVDNSIFQKELMEWYKTIVFMRNRALNSLSIRAFINPDELPNSPRPSYGHLWIRFKLIQFSVWLKEPISQKVTEEVFLIELNFNPWEVRISGHATLLQSNIHQVRYILALWKVTKGQETVVLAKWKASFSNIANGRSPPLSSWKTIHPVPLQKQPYKAPLLPRIQNSISNSITNSSLISLKFHSE